MDLTTLLFLVLGILIVAIIALASMAAVNAWRSRTPPPANTNGEPTHFTHEAPRGPMGGIGFQGTKGPVTHHHETSAPPSPLDERYRQRTTAADRYKRKPL